MKLVVAVLLLASLSYAGFSVEDSGCLHASKTLLTSTRQHLKFNTSLQIERYLKDTIHGLELMRGENGLVMDKVQIISKSKYPGHFELKVLNSNTSPTNVALDLITQLQLLEKKSYKALALTNITEIISTLERLQYHKPSGLFFSWYHTDFSSLPAVFNVSSIDNLHLALALFTAKKSLPESEIAGKADRLLRRMNFSIYLDSESGLIGGNLRRENNKWVKEAYNFSELGSEARQLYSVGWALGLFRDHMDRLELLQKAFLSLRAEVAFTPQGEILKLWDGGGFQLLLPKILLGEEQYSPRLRKIFMAYADYILAEGKRQNFPLPAGHSACNFGVENQTLFDGVPSYNGKAGSPFLVSSQNKDIHISLEKKNWDTVVTPHVLVMAATSNPQKYLPHLQTIESLGGESQTLYRSHIGFMDGIHVKGELTGTIVPVELSLDQGMIALSLLQMSSPDQMGLSARALYSEPEIRKRMLYFYNLFERKLDSLLFQKSVGNDGSYMTYVK